MTRKLALAVAALLLIGGGMLLYGQRQVEPGLTPFTVAAEGAATQADDGAAAEVDTSTVKEMSLGNPDASVEVVEYASFTCPHCRNFAETVYPKIKANYIDTGKIHFVYREVYFDRFGLWAGMVARCGGGMRYFGIADMIYEKQKEWTQGQPAQIAENLKTIGKTAGLSGDELDACLSDEAKAKALVKVFEDTTKADDVNATPTFIINGQKYSNMTYEDFSKILDEKIGG